MADTGVHALFRQLSVDGAPVSAANPLPVSAGGDPGGGAVAVAGSATVTDVAGLDANVTLLAANADRIGVLIHNNSTATLYLKYGATASIAAGGYSVAMEPGSYWEMPQPVYRGQIDGIWSAAAGYCNITEVE